MVRKIFAESRFLAQNFRGKSISCAKFSRKVRFLAQNFRGKSGCTIMYAGRARLKLERTFIGTFKKKGLTLRSFLGPRPDGEDGGVCGIWCIGIER